MRGLIVIAIAAAALCLAPAAQASPCLVRPDASRSTRSLDSDLVCGGSTALIVNGDDITLDLDGHAVEAAGTVTWGVRNTAGSDRTTVRNGTVRGFDQAGVAMTADDGVVEDVILEANDTGVNLASARGARAEGNRFDQNQQAVSVHNDDPTQGGNVVRSNVIVGQSPLYSSGMTLFSTTGNLIADNTLSGVLDGVALFDRTIGTRVEGNEILIAGEQDGWGMILFADEEVSDNVILGNTIEGGSVGIWHSLTGTGSRYREQHDRGVRYGDSVGSDVARYAHRGQRGR